LKKQVDESEWLAVSYDESLNKVIQESEMDLVLRFWDTQQSSSALLGFDVSWACQLLPTY